MVGLVWVNLARLKGILEAVLDSSVRPRWLPQVFAGDLSDLLRLHKSNEANSVPAMGLN